MSIRKFNLIVAGLFLSMYISAQQIIHVGELALPGTYTSLQSAVDAALDGDTIYVHPGVNNYGNALISGKQLVIIGAGYHVEEQDDSLGISTYTENSILNQVTFGSGSEGSVLIGCHVISIIRVENVGHVNISRNYTADIYLSNADTVEVVGNFVNGGGTYDIDVNNSTGCLISNNIAQRGVRVHNGSTGVTVRRNIFWSTYGSSSIDQSTFIDNIVFTGFSSTGSIVQNNLFSTNLTAYQNDNLVNVNSSDVFVGFPTQGDYSFDARFKLSVGSPAIGYALDGGDCGVYDGMRPYKLSGIPPIPLIAELNAPGGVIIENDTLTIQVKIRTEN